MSTTALDKVIAPPSLKRTKRIDIRSTAFAASLWACLLIASLFLFAVLLVILQEGLARFDWALISEQPSRLRPESSGVQSAIFGTLWVMLGTILLALLILPVIIITTREALRAVPQDIRQASLALGATQWQTTWRQVLPSAVSGIATGAILALSRAIGEAAPLILVGATVFVTFNPEGFLDRYTVLPVQIFNLVKLPEAANLNLAWATILLLILILLAMNGLAIWLRNRFRRSW
jgi:ABC-type phosphate transport system permease subunit